VTRADLLESIADDLAVALEAVASATVALSKLCAELHDYAAEEAAEAAHEGGECFTQADISARIASARADLERFTAMDAALRAFVAKSERASRVHEAAAALVKARRADAGVTP